MNQLPIKINNLQFAKQKQTLSGRLDAMTFSRLAESLAKSNAQDSAPGALAGNCVDYVLTGWLDVQDRPFLKLTLDAHMHMLCQRCLLPMSIDLHLDFIYMVTNQSEEEMLVSEEMDDDVDLLALDTQMDVGQIIEDELLMTLPIAPVHAQACAQLAMSSGEKANPFAALQKLKK